VIRYFGHALRTQLSHGRSLYFLSVLGVALGVASVVSIQILNHNSLAAFSGGVRAISGDAQLSVLGTTGTFSDSLYPAALADPDVSRAWPLYRLAVALTADPEVFLDVVGTDLLGSTPIRLGEAANAAEGDAESKAGRGEPAGSVDEEGDDAGALSADPFAFVAAAVTEPGWVALTPAFAQERGLAVGDTLAVSSGSRRVRLRIGALVDFQRYAPLASRTLAVMDIAQVQSLLGRSGRLHQIDVVLRDGADLEAVRARLSSRLGPGVRLQTPGERVDDAAGLLAAFRLNLTALSLISLFVGVFLIFSSTQAALVRRRGEFGLLRSLGATRAQTLGLILGEVALLGALGVLVGLPLGAWAAERNVHLVSATLTDIYLLSAIETLELPWTIYAIAAGVGIGGALLGAILPSAEAARHDPRALLVAYQVHESTARRSGRLALAGLAVLVLSWTLHFAGASTFRESGFGLGLALLVGLPLLTPWTLDRICGGIAPRGFDLSLAFRNLGARLQTTAFAVASLAIAVSMMIGITFLVSSFRATLATWVESSIRADVYVTTESWVRAGSEAELSPEVRTVLGAHPAVRGVEELRRVPTRVAPGVDPARLTAGLRGEDRAESPTDRTVHAGPASGRSVPIAGVSLSLPDSFYTFPLRSGTVAEVLRSLRTEQGALISEPLARRTGLDRGDRLLVATPRGPVALPVAGVSYDYSNEGGSVFVAGATLDALFGPGPVENVALFLAPDADPEAVIGELRARLGGAPLLLRSNRTIRTEIFRIFDQTFAITRLLQGMALLVAACGISLTLLVLARERVGELALLRSLGAERRQIFGLFVGEGVSLATLGIVLGSAGGLVLAAILIYVINPAFFGWTIRPAWSWSAWSEQTATILVVAVLASLYPALRASRVPAQELSREDL
jgi:putative ABC transport system permease protein